MTSGPDQPALGDVMDDDALLTLLAQGHAPAGDAPDPAAPLLRRWRGELDVAEAAAPPRRIPLAAVGRSTRRTTAIAGIVAVSLLGMTGTAAALGGSAGPLGSVHRVLFGTPAATGPTRVPVDELATRASRLLDDVAHRLAAAGPGGPHGVDRATAIAHLAEADTLLRLDRHAPAALIARSADLRRRLGQVPTAVTPHPVATARRASAPVGTRRPVTSATPVSTGGDQQRTAPDEQSTGSPEPVTSAAPEPSAVPEASADPSTPDGEAHLETPAPSSGDSGGDGS